MQRLTRPYSYTQGYYGRDGVTVDDVYNEIGKIENILYAPDGTELITLDRLRELVQADAEGRALIASTKVGDILYTTSMYRNGSIEECRVTCHRISTWVSGANHEPWGGGFEEEDFGDTVFLTRAAAEQAKGERE